MFEQQVGRPVQADDGLAAPRPPLHDEDPGQRGSDDLVLLGLDRGDDVAHPPGAPRRERGHQRPPEPRAPHRAMHEEAFDLAVVQVVHQRDAAHRDAVEARDEELDVRVGELFGVEREDLVRFEHLPQGGIALGDQVTALFGQWGFGPDLDGRKRGGS